MAAQQPQRPAPLAANVIANPHDRVGAAVDRLDVGHYPLPDVLSVKANGVPAGAQGTMKTETALAYEAALTAYNGVMICYVDEDGKKQFVPRGDTHSLCLTALNQVRETDRSKNIERWVYAQFPSLGKDARTEVEHHMRASSALLDHHPDDVTHLKNNYRLASGRQAAGRMYLDPDVYSKPHVWTFLFGTTLLGLALSKLPEMVHQPGVSNEHKQNEAVLKEFKKTLYSSFHTHRDVCRFTPFEKIHLRSLKALHPESDALSKEKSAAVGAHSFLQYFYFVHVYKDLHAGRDVDDPRLLDVIPATFKASFAPILESGAISPAARKDKGNKENEPAAPKETTGRGQGATKRPTPAIIYFPGNTKSEYDALCKHLNVPQAKRSPLYHAIIKAQLTPGHTGGALDKPKIEAEWEKIK